MNWVYWALLSAGFAGATALLAKAGLNGVNSHVAAAWRTSVAVLFAWLLVCLAARGEPVFSLPRRAWWLLGLSGLATGASWLCYFRALQLGEASRVAGVDKLSVVVVGVGAVLFLGEALTWRMALGLALVTSGAIMLATK